MGLIYCYMDLSGWADNASALIIGKLDPVGSHSAETMIKKVSLVFMPSIFLLQENTKLVEMMEKPYESEDLLQKLLADHPSVLAGDQFVGTEPKRWLLVTREAAVPCEDCRAGTLVLRPSFCGSDGNSDAG
jgi:hypothetical protein